MTFTTPLECDLDEGWNISADRPNVRGRRTKETHIASKQLDFLRQTSRQWVSRDNWDLKWNQRMKDWDRSESRKSLILKWPSHKTRRKTTEIPADKTAAWHRWTRGRKWREKCSFSSNAQTTLYSALGWCMKVTTPWFQPVVKSHTSVHLTARRYCKSNFG